MTKGQIEEIIDDLINAQPHIAECANASFIDDHINAAIKKLRSLDHSIESSAMLEVDDMTLPVFPNGYARHSVCICETRERGRTMIDGKWRLVCMRCGTLYSLRIKRGL